MLSLFPTLLFLSPLSALLIRAALASVFALASYMHARTAESWYLSSLAVIECVVALSLALGTYTQAGALCAFGITLLWLTRGRPTRPYPLSTTLLVLFMSISVLITGPGALSIDLPL